MRIRIVSDGTPHGTRVEDIDTGDRLRYIQAIGWEIGMDGLATALLRIRNVPINVVADVDLEKSEIVAGDSELEDSVTIRQPEHDLEAPEPVDSALVEDEEMQRRAGL